MNNMTYEDSYKELEQIVIQLQQENIDIDKSIELFKRGIKLQKHCESILNIAEDSIVKILNDENQLDVFSHDKEK
ncbi:MAG: exodeoxyribonuclease VII small subunit [Mycoplasmatales bacterium]